MIKRENYTEGMTKREKRQALSTLKKVRAWLFPEKGKDKGVVRWIKGAWGLKPGISYYTKEPISVQADDASEVTCACLEGAINVVQGFNAAHTGRLGQDPAAKVIGDLLPSRYHLYERPAIAAWNDVKSRKVQDVCNLLDTAIATLDTELNKKEKV